MSGALPVEVEALLREALVNRLHEAAVELGNNGVPIKPLSRLLMEAAAALAAAPAQAAPPTPVPHPPVAGAEHLVGERERCQRGCVGPWERVDREQWAWMHYVVWIKLDEAGEAWGAGTRDGTWHQDEHGRREGSKYFRHQHEAMAFCEQHFAFMQGERAPDPFVQFPAEWQAASRPAPSGEQTPATPQAAAGAWRPIESAPRDKTRVVLAHFRGKYAIYGTGYWMPMEGWRNWYFDEPNRPPPTHWMPLPPPPVEPPQEPAA